MVSELLVSRNISILDIRQESVARECHSTMSYCMAGINSSAQECNWKRVWNCTVEQYVGGLEVAVKC